MSNESIVEGVSQIDGRAQRAEKLVEHLLSEMGIYHNHKEVMAHASLLVMLALCGGILQANPWPPTWVPEMQLMLSRHWIAFFGALFLWALMHFYMRWQLRNRRSAALTYGGALRALAQWANREPTVDDLTPYIPEKKKRTWLTPIGRFLATLIDYVVPFPWATLHYDVEKDDYPKWLGDEIRKQEKKSTGAIKAEWLVTLVSFFIFLVIAARTLK